MSRIMLVTLTCLLMLLGLRCGYDQTSAVDPHESERARNSHSGLNDPCEEWQRRFALLTNEGKATLFAGGITINGEDRLSETGYYVLGMDLVGDCHLRNEIGILLFAVVNGIQSAEQSEFASLNSELITQVIEKIWYAPGFSADGTVHEKYLLLTFDGIQDENMADLISSLLMKEGLNDELFYSIRKRPLKGLVKPFNEMHSRFRESNDPRGQARALMALFTVTQEETYLEELEEIRSKQRIDKSLSEAIANLLIQLREGSSLSDEDLQVLGINGDS